MLFLFIFEMWFLCLVWCSIIFNICTLEAEVGGLGEFLANLKLADLSCNMWLCLKNIRNSEAFFIWSFTELFLKFFTVQTPVCLTNYKVPCLDKNEKAVHGTDVDPLHMYDSCFLGLLSVGSGHYLMLWLTILGSYFSYWVVLHSLNTKGGAKSYPNLVCQCFVDTHGRPASLRTETEDALMGCRWQAGRGIRKRGWSWHYSQDVK